MIGGMVGVKDNITIGNNVKIGAKSGIHKDIKDGEKVLGIPFNDIKKTTRQWSAIPRLPRLLARVRELERKIVKLSEK